VQIHDGPYNVLNNWNYSELIRVFNGSHGKAKAFKAPTNQTLLDAISAAKKADTLCFIEVILDKDDCNKNLLDWCARVANYNGRVPRVKNS